MSMSEMKYSDSYIGWTSGGGNLVAPYYIDNSYAGVTWSVIPIPIFYIKQGTAQQDRIGDEIYISSLEIAMRFHPIVSTAGVRSDQVTCELYTDNQCNGALPSNTAIKSNTNYASFRNPDNTQRFHMVHKREHNVYTVQATAGAPDVLTVTNACSHLVIPIKKKVKFQSNGGTIADMPRFCIYLMACSFRGTSFNLDVTCRTRFKDA